MGVQDGCFNHTFDASVGVTEIPGGCLGTVLFLSPYGQLGLPHSTADLGSLVGLWIWELAFPEGTFQKTKGEVASVRR